MTISSTSTSLRPGVFTSTTLPLNPYTGQLVYESDTGNIELWTGSVWQTYNFYNICTSTTRPTAVTEGSLIYETDTNRINYYDGSAWKYVSVSGGTPGSIIQVQTVSNSTRSAIATQDISAIPGLSITFTPKQQNSVLLLMAGVSHEARYVVTLGFLKNGANLSSVNNTNSNGSIATMYDGSDVTDFIWYTQFMFTDTPNTTSAITYAAAATSSWAGGIRTMYINNRTSNDMASVSTMTIMEIAQ